MTLILLDQATKVFAISGTLPALPLMQWTLVYNPGVSFGFAQSLPLGWHATLQLMLWLYIYRSYPHAFARVLITAGFFSNLADRFTHGAVVDFINISMPTLSLPFTFNLADTYIFIAGCYIIYEMISNNQLKTGNSS